MESTNVSEKFLKFKESKGISADNDMSLKELKGLLREFFEKEKEVINKIISSIPLEDIDDLIEDSI